MGRPPIGKIAMTSTERSRRRRSRLHAPKPATEHADEIGRLRAENAALQKELEAAKARIAELEDRDVSVWQADLDARVRDEIERRVAAEMPDYRKTYADAQMIQACHDGVMPRKEFVKILARLSPDACPGDDVRNAEAFKLFKKYEAVLCKPEPRPLPTGLPKTVAELMALRRAGKEKRRAAAKRGAETRRARSGKAPRLDHRA